MIMVPCKKCKSCGMYHDLTVAVCDACEADMRDIPAVMMDTDKIPGDKFGEIDKDRQLSVYVQKCPACGTLNFTSDPERPVQYCANCTKARVAFVEVKLYDPEAEKKPVPEVSAEPAPATAAAGVAKTIFDASADEDEDDDEDGAPSIWGSVLGNIRSTMGTPEPAPAAAPKSVPAVEEEDGDEDDDESPSGWGTILGGAPAPHKTPAPRRDPAITLTALRFGCLSFTIEPGPDVEYMLGRSANQSELLNKDPRVSNRHCVIYFRNGMWYVRDNHSSNGTAVNSMDIGQNGECRLNDGDELKLGHHHDSAAFRVSIL